MERESCLLKLMSRSRCWGLIALASLIMYATTAIGKPDWAVLNVKIVGELEVTGVDYGSPFRANATLYYFEDVSFVVVDDGSSKLVFEHSHKPNFARYWKLGTDRLLKTYTARGEDTLRSVSPYSMQYRFIHRDEKPENRLAQDPEAVEYNFSDTADQSTMEVLFPLPPNIHVTVTTLVRHPNHRITHISRTTVEEALVDGPAWKRGDQRTRLGLNIDFRGAWASTPSVAELIEVSERDYNNKRTRLFVFTIRQVEAIPTPVDLDSLREELVKNLEEVVNESYNPYFSAAGPGQGRVGGEPVFHAQLIASTRRDRSGAVDTGSSLSDSCSPGKEQRKPAWTLACGIARGCGHSVRSRFHRGRPLPTRSSPWEGRPRPL